MATFHFAAGKKEKISKGDIVGFLTQKGKLAADEIGLIEIKDHYSYVAVTRDKAHETLTRLKKDKREKSKDFFRVLKSTFYFPSTIFSNACHKLSDGTGAVTLTSSFETGWTNSI